jgi:uncharacterized protein (TIGR00255 family)
VRSMTGYGTGVADLGRGRLVVEARAVNHRFLDVLVRFPPEIAEQAWASEAVVRRLAERGRIEITARVEGTVGGEVVIDLDRARAAYRSLVAFRDELSPGEPVPLYLLASVPGLFTAAEAPDAGQVRQAVEQATEQACLQLGQMREVEGEALAADLSKRIERLLELTCPIDARCPAAVAGYREKLRSRIQNLVQDCEIIPDPGRLEHEVALFADRSDISEEITRLRSHCEQLRDILSTESGPTGRRIEFLLQEMVREVNTIGSKTSDLEITRPVIELKTEIERMREQAHNIL